METICGSFEGTVLFEKGDFTISTWESEDLSALPESLRPKRERTKRARFSVKGYNIPLYKGISYRLGGGWKTDKSGRLSFEAHECVPIEPSASAERIAYLSSGLIKGISPKQAAAIDAKFGNDTFRVIDEAPELLMDIPGIGPRRMGQIQESYHKTKLSQELHQLLGNVNVSFYMTDKILKELGENAAEKISQNPYILTTAVEMDFLEADAIARKLGVDCHSHKRLEAALDDTFRKGRKRGHLFLYKEDAVRYTLQLLNRGATGDKVVSYDEFMSVLSLFIKEQDYIEKDKQRLYPKYYALVEEESARMLVQLAMSPLPFDADKCSAAVRKYVNSVSFELDKKQLAAIKWGLVKRLLILTGGPGTGKTTTIKGLIQSHRAIHPDKKIFMLAPTGRAARRATEATGEPAMTVDKLLTYLDSDDTSLLSDLQTGLIICDEVSMVDAMHLFNLLKHLTPASHLILVGDPNQLKSVGPGDVLRQMLISGCIPFVRLNAVFRQGADSPIIANSIKIEQGETDLLWNEKFRLIEAKNDEECRQLLKQEYLATVQQVGYENVALLTPRRTESIIGCDRMNTMIKEAVGTKRSNQCIHANGLDFHPMDRIMENENSDKGNNGDVGYIKDIRYVEVDGNKTFQAIIHFDGIENDVPYLKEDMESVTFGYAYTIHKSQGSEYRKVIMPMMESDKGMLRRNLFYTGVTRAKEAVTIIGSKAMVELAIRQMDTDNRNTMLCELIIREMQKYKKD